MTRSRETRLIYKTGLIDTLSILRKIQLHRWHKILIKGSRHVRKISKWKIKWTHQSHQSWLETNSSNSMSNDLGNGTLIRDKYLAIYKRLRWDRSRYGTNRKTANVTSPLSSSPEHSISIRVAKWGRTKSSKYILRRIKLTSETTSTWKQGMQKRGTKARFWATVSSSQIKRPCYPQESIRTLHMTLRHKWG